MTAYDARREYDEPRRDRDDEEERSRRYGQESRRFWGREGDFEREYWNEPYARGGERFGRGNEPEQGRGRGEYSGRDYWERGGERFGRERGQMRERTQPYYGQRWESRERFNEPSYRGEEFGERFRNEERYRNEMRYGRPSEDWGSRYGRPYQDLGSRENWGGTRYGAGWYEGIQQRERDFRGRGPRGYQRSDDRIKEDVNDRLTDHPEIDASDIEVKVKDGEVNLSGEVNDRREKRMAEDIIETISGVREVHNEIRVRSRSGVGSFSSGGMVLGKSLRTRMEVRSSDGHRLGEVKELRGNEFILDRPSARDLYVPMNAVQEVRDDHVMLSVPTDRVDQMGWQTTEFFGKEKERR